MNKSPTVSDVMQATKRLAGVALPTPLLECPLPDGLSGRLFVKLETEQVTGSFKFRGAWNRISQLSEVEKSAGVVAYSSGNHAQAVAAVAKRIGIPAVIVMPEDAPPMKINNTRGFGAEVITYDRWSESREEIAGTIRAERGMTLIPPFDDPGIIAGQGTVGLEIATAMRDLSLTPDCVLVPCSGGGLVSGTALALHEDFPDCSVYAVEPDGFDDTRRSLKTGDWVKNDPDARSICDALLVPTPGKITFPVMQQHLAGGLSVSDEAAIEAMRFCYQTLGKILEPGGAVALAAVLDSKIDIADRQIVAVCSGGNIDKDLFQKFTGLAL